MELVVRREFDGWRNGSGVVGINNELDGVWDFGVEGI